jgi:hypothetical protein
LNLSTREKSEVDLRVAQELKNNRDFIYETNQKLQSLSQGMIALSLENDKIIKKYESEKKGLAILVENLEVDMRKTFLETKLMIDEFLLRIESQVTFIRHTVEACPEIFVTKSDSDPVINNILDSILDLTVSFERFSEGNASSLAHVKQYSETKVDELRKELNNQPSEAHALESKINSRLLDMQGNHLGLVGEITQIRKELHYAKKKFENIYTLIERLKVGKNEPSR